MLMSLVPSFGVEEVVSNPWREPSLRLVLNTDRRLPQPITKDALASDKNFPIKQESSCEGFRDLHSCTEHRKVSCQSGNV